jgi:hypothetical protein
MHHRITEQDSKALQRTVININAQTEREREKKADITEVIKVHHPQFTLSYPTQLLHTITITNSTSLQSSQQRYCQCLDRQT